MVTGKGREGTEIGGRYRVQRLLGEGGFAAVYLAEHKVTGMRLALKILHPNVSQMEGSRERFIRETQIVSQLQHPNIARIFDADFIEEEGTAYAAMEFLDGESFAEKLERSGPMSTKEAAPIMGDVLRALSVAHKRDVVHRDVKPENIFLCRDHDGREIAKVLDFGIAHTEKANSPKLTQAGMLVGSPLYMSPEQVTGDTVTAATDLWAVGVVFYEALTGTVPFNGESVMEIFNKILWKDPAPITERLAPGIQDIILKALSKRPGDRFASAEEMARSIDKVTAIRRPSSMRPSSASVVPPWSLDSDAPKTAPSSRPPAKSTSFNPGPPRPTVPAGPPKNVDVVDLGAVTAVAPTSTRPLGSPPVAPSSAPPALVAPAPKAPAANEFDLDDLGFSARTETPAPLDDLSFTAVPQAPKVPAEASISGLDWGPSLVPSHPTVSEQPPPPVLSEPVRVDRPESEVKTMMTPEVIDRTGTRLIAKERPRSINPWLALIAIVAVTGGMLKLSWRFIADAVHGDPGRNARALLPPPDLTDPVEPTAPPPDLRAESQTPVAVGEQLHQAPPAGLSREDALRFAEHMVALPRAESPRFRTAGFASCSRDTVYVHPGGANGVMRSARAAIACERGDLSVTSDLDNDRLADVVAVDRRNGGVVVIGSERLSSGRRFAVPGARAVYGGLTLEGGEPGAVVYVNPDGRHPGLVAVGLRRGRVAWRSPEALHVGEPVEFGLSVGPDADGDRAPDVLVGETVDAQRCFELLSGATGERKWPAPVCFEGILIQSLSLGPDINHDGRGDVAVGHQGEAVLRLYSGANGTVIREIHADSTAAQFGWPVMLVPDLARDGFADLVVGNSTPGNATVEVFSSNDAHRVATWDIVGTVTPGRIRLQFADGFAYEGGRSVMLSTPERGVSVVATVAAGP